MVGREIHSFGPFLHTGNRAHAGPMRYLVTLTDGTTETVGPADSFQHEGPMTTFFASERHRGTLDCWSTKLASFRTERILKIVRRDEAAAPAA